MVRSLLGCIAILTILGCEKRSSSAVEAETPKAQQNQPAKEQSGHDVASIELRVLGMT